MHIDACFSATFDSAALHDLPSHFLFERTESGRGSLRLLFLLLPWPSGPSQRDHHRLDMETTGKPPDTIHDMQPPKQIDIGKLFLISHAKIVKRFCESFSCGTFEGEI
jgi:hypothetical protein